MNHLLRFGGISVIGWWKEWTFKHAKIVCRYVLKCVTGLSKAYVILLKGEKLAKLHFYFVTSGRKVIRKPFWTSVRSYNRVKGRQCIYKVSLSWLYCNYLMISYMSYRKPWWPSLIFCTLDYLQEISELQGGFFLFPKYFQDVSFCHNFTHVQTNIN